MSPRREQLMGWLSKVEARHLQQVKGPQGSVLDFYAVGKTVIVLQIFNTSSEGGEISWEMYAPVSLSPETELTFKDAEAFIAKANAAAEVL